MSSHISAKVPVFLSLQTKGKNANKDNDCMDILTSNRDISKKTRVQYDMHSNNLRLRPNATSCIQVYSIIKCYIPTCFGIT